MKKKLWIYVVAIAVVVIGLLAFVLHSCNGEEDPSSCIVTFEENGGTTVVDQAVVKGGVLSLSDIGETTREGYIFEGWYASQELTGNPWDFSADTVWQDMTLFAKWSLVEYTLTLDVPADAPCAIIATREGTQLSSGAKITIEDIISLEMQPTGDTELSGRLVVRGSKNLFEFSDGVLKNVATDVTVSYTELAEGEYWITYEGVRGVEHGNPETYMAGTELVLVAPGEKPGYTFVGWYIGDEPVERLIGREGDLTVVARWEPISYQVTYENVEGAVNENPSTYSIETTGALLAAEKDGYSFQGWYIGEKRILSFDGMTGDLVLTAKWGPEVKKSIFAVQNMTQNGDSFTTGTVYGWKYARTKADYTYSKVEIETTIVPSADNAGLGFYIGQGDDGFIIEFTGWTDSYMYMFVNGVYEANGLDKGMVLTPLAGKKLPVLKKDEPVDVKLQYDGGWVMIYYKVNDAWDLVLVGDAIGAANRNSKGVTFDRNTPVRAGVAAWETATDAGTFKNVTVRSWNGSIEPYSIIYKGVEGVTHSNPDLYVKENAASIVFKNPSNREGYVFEGWYIGDEAVTSLEGRTGDVTVTARWRERTEEDIFYALTNMDQLGSDRFATGNIYGWKVAHTENTYDGFSIEMTITATADNGAIGFYIGQGDNGTLLTFCGWADYIMYTHVNGAYEKNMETKGMTLTPNAGQTLPMPKAGVSVDVRMDYHAGQVRIYQKVADGLWKLLLDGDAFAAANGNSRGIVFDPAKPVYAGFGAWEDNASAATFTNIKITEWTPGQEETYSITYELNGGVNPADAPVSYTPGSAENVVLPIPTKTDYDFGGWYAGETLINNLIGLTGNITLTAEWRNARWYTYGTGVNTVTDESDTSVTMSKAGGFSNTEGWLLSKATGKYAVADATWVYDASASRFGGGFYLSDGTNKTLIMFHTHPKCLEIYQHTTGWKANVSVKDTSMLDGLAFDPMDVRMVYNNGTVQLFLKQEDGSYAAWTDKFSVASYIDATKEIHVGVGFWESGIAGGTIRNFSVDWTEPDVEDTAWYTYGTGVDTVTDESDTSVTMSKSSGNDNSEGWLLSNATGKHAVADATWVYDSSASRFGGGFYLSDGTNKTLIMFHTYPKCLEIYQHTTVWKANVSVKDTSMLDGQAFDPMDVRMIYSNGTVQLFLKQEDGSYAAWTDKFSVASYIDTAKEIHVGIGFWSSGIAGGTIRNFSVDWTEDDKPALSLPNATTCGGGDKLHTVWTEHTGTNFTVEATFTPDTGLIDGLNGSAMGFAIKQGTTEIVITENNLGSMFTVGTDAEHGMGGGLASVRWTNGTGSTQIFSVAGQPVTLKMTYDKGIVKIYDANGNVLYDNIDLSQDKWTGIDWDQPVTLGFGLWHGSIDWVVRTGGGTVKNVEFKEHTPTISADYILPNAENNGCDATNEKAAHYAWTEHSGTEFTVEATFIPDMPTINGRPELNGSALGFAFKQGDNTILLTENTAGELLTISVGGGTARWAGTSTTAMFPTAGAAVTLKLTYDNGIVNIYDANGNVLYANVNLSTDKWTAFDWTQPVTVGFGTYHGSIYGLVREGGGGINDVKFTDTPATGTVYDLPNISTNGCPEKDEKKTHYVWTEESGINFTVKATFTPDTDAVVNPDTIRNLSALGFAFKQGDKTFMLTEEESYKLMALTAPGGSNNADGQRWTRTSTTAMFQEAGQEYTYKLTYNCGVINIYAEDGTVLYANIDLTGNTGFGIDWTQPVTVGFGVYHGSISGQQRTGGGTVGSVKFIENVVAGWDEYKSADAAQRAEAYEDAANAGKTTLFIGDSFFDTTQSFWSTFASDLRGKDALVLGIGGTTAEDWYNYSSKGIFMDGTGVAPKNIVINIGNNDYYTDNWDVANCEAKVMERFENLFILLHAKYPNTNFYVFSTITRTGKYASENCTSSIAPGNALVKAWCENKGWITYVDLSDSTIELKDDIHPQDAYYASVYLAKLAEAGCVIEDIDLTGADYSLPNVSTNGCPAADEKRTHYAWTGESGTSFTVVATFTPDSSAVVYTDTSRNTSAMGFAFRQGDKTFMLTEEESYKLMALTANGSNTVEGKRWERTRTTAMFPYAGKAQTYKLSYENGVINIYAEDGTALYVNINLTGNTSFGIDWTQPVEVGFGVYHGSISGYQRTGGGAVSNVAITDSVPAVEAQYTLPSVSTNGCPAENEKKTHYEWTEESGINFTVTATFTPDSSAVVNPDTIRNVSALGFAFKQGDKTFMLTEEECYQLMALTAPGGSNNVEGTRWTRTSTTAMFQEAGQKYTYKLTYNCGVINIYAEDGTVLYADIDLTGNTSFGIDWTQPVTVGFGVYHGGISGQQRTGGGTVNDVEFTDNSAASTVYELPSVSANGCPAENEKKTHYAWTEESGINFTVKATFTPDSSAVVNPDTIRNVSALGFAFKQGDKTFMLTEEESYKLMALTAPGGSNNVDSGRWTRTSTTAMFQEAGQKYTYKLTYNCGVINIYAEDGTVLYANIDLTGNTSFGIDWTQPVTVGFGVYHGSISGQQRTGGGTVEDVKITDNSATRSTVYTTPEITETAGITSSNPAAVDGLLMNDIQATTLTEQVTVVSFQKGRKTVKLSFPVPSCY